MHIAKVAPRLSSAGLACIVVLALLACGQPEATPTSLTFPDATVGIPATKDLKITNVAESGV
jgi:hypothetical protein